MSSTNIFAQKEHTAFQKSNTRNILYVGLKNSIEVYAPGIDSSTLKVKFLPNYGPTGEIRKDSLGHYTVTIKGPGICQLGIYDGIMLINSQKYMCYIVPDPCLTLAGRYKGGEISGSVLREQAGVIPLLENWELPNTVFAIDRFSMTYESRGELVKVENKGPLFSEQIKSLFLKASSKDIIVISNIIAVGPDGYHRHLAPIAFVVI